MMQILSRGYLNDKLALLTKAIPRQYRIGVKASKHFISRAKLRAPKSEFALMMDVLECVKYNYPLILYYSKLDTILPERGRLESDKYVICGDVINDEFYLRTIYEK